MCCVKVIKRSHMQKKSIFLSLPVVERDTAQIVPIRVYTTKMYLHLVFNGPSSPAASLFNSSADLKWPHFMSIVEFELPFQQLECSLTFFFMPTYAESGGWCLMIWYCKRLSPFNQALCNFTGYLWNLTYTAIAECYFLAKMQEQEFKGLEKEICSYIYKAEKSMEELQKLMIRKRRWRRRKPRTKHYLLTSLGA